MRMLAGWRALAVLVAIVVSTGAINPSYPFDAWSPPHGAGEAMPAGEHALDPSFEQLEAPVPAAPAPPTPRTKPHAATLASPHAAPAHPRAVRPRPVRRGHGCGAASPTPDRAPPCFVAP